MLKMIERLYLHMLRREIKVINARMRREDEVLRDAQTSADRMRTWASAWIRNASSREKTAIDNWATSRTAMLSELNYAQNTLEDIELNQKGL